MRDYKWLHEYCLNRFGSVAALEARLPTPRTEAELRQIGQNGGLQQQAGKAVLPCRAGPRDGGGAGSALRYRLGLDVAWEHGGYD